MQIIDKVTGIIEETNVKILRWTQFNLKYSTSVFLCPRQISFLCAFSDNCAYDVGKEQGDWMKLTGLSFNLFRSKINSAMCAFKWNLDSQRMDLGLYLHVDKSFSPPTDEEIMCSVGLNEFFIVTFDFDKKSELVTMFIQTNSGIFAKSADFKRFGLCRIINTWFGGTPLAPHTIDLVVKKIEQENSAWGRFYNTEINFT